MIKVIETNLLFGDEDILRDHQSLTYEVESWDGFIEGVKKGIFDVKNATMPINKEHKRSILNIKHDEYHMEVDYDNRQKSLFYAIGLLKPPYKPPYKNK